MEPMKLHQVAIQLYTLRDFTKTPKDIAATMKKVREIGYEAVQASAMGPIPEEELLKILAGEGLTLCATHEPSDLILDEPERVAERLTKLNCKYTAYPHPKDIDLGSESAVEQWLNRLNHAGKILHEAGRRLFTIANDIPTSPTRLKRLRLFRWRRESRPRSSPRGRPSRSF